MSVEPALLSIRFGTGRSAILNDPQRPEDLLTGLLQADGMQEAYPTVDLASVRADLVRLGELRKAVRNKLEAEAEEKVRAEQRAARARFRVSLKASVARGVESATPLRERLAWFWADHFTVAPSVPPERRLPGVAFVDEAIRPNITGRFADMLRAATLHPAMLSYLDQSSSVGPNSRAAQNSPGRGLNENLARELLELHTLGVDGDYSQTDVRQLAELLAGLYEDNARGLRFLPKRGEPGPERVLGKEYGGDKPALADIEAVLEDLSTHPDTARHIARKLAVHFVSDAPEPALVDALAQRYAQTGGDLMAVTEALVTNPLALKPERRKVRQPFDFVVASLRALGIRGPALSAMTDKAAAKYLHNPLQKMGQPWLLAPGPDGWSEASEEWASPQGLANRIRWVGNVTKLLGDGLPDPRAFVVDALGPLASERLVWAAGAAETRRDGVALVLASPDFQRR